MAQEKGIIINEIALNAYMESFIEKKTDERKKRKEEKERQEAKERQEVQERKKNDKKKGKDNEEKKQKLKRYTKGELSLIHI